MQSYLSPATPTGSPATLTREKLMKGAYIKTHQGGYFHFKKNLIHKINIFYPPQIHFWRKPCGHLS
jgi:hypothetical protein